MGPKKGKGNKLARMSDEERARYLQHRAAIEEEARRRKEQLIETFMKNKLKKEEAFSRLNVAKINQQWRFTLRLYKCSELKQDLEALFLLFNHTSNKKTRLIDSLIEDLQEAEGQYSRIHQCHMETVDKLLLIYNERISHLQEIFEDHRDRTYEKARADVNEIVETAEADQEHLHAIIFKMHQVTEQNAKEIQAVHNARIDELRNSMLTELENLVNSREATMETIWSDFQAVLHNYWTQTEDRRREYLNLKDTDGENCQQIFQYHQQIKALSDVMQGIRKQLGNINNGGDERVIEKKAERANCTELYHVLRRKLVVEKEADRRNLCFMTEAAEKTTKNLTMRLEKCQKIIHLTNLCKKYETVEEQEVPGNYVCSQLSDNAEKVIKEELSFFNEPLAEEEFRKCKQLDGFWRRYSKVFLEKEALFLQNKALQKEQKHIKSALRQYFAEFSTNPAPPKGPLLIERAAEQFRVRRPISLVGERMAPRTGKTSSCGHTDHAPSFVHRLTIELTKQ